MALDKAKVALVAGRGCVGENRKGGEGMHVQEEGSVVQEEGEHGVRGVQGRGGYAVQWGVQGKGRTVELRSTGEGVCDSRGKQGKGMG